MKCQAVRPVLLWVSYDLGGGFLEVRCLSRDCPIAVEGFRHV